MTDEKYTFIEDVREKKKTATGAHHRRTHCGKGGAIRFPSDFKSKKELRAMNGEVKSYKLNDPVSWKEFKAWPDDIKITYITALRKKYNVSDRKIAEMLGVDQVSVSREMRRLGIPGSKRGRHTVWDEDGWYAWVNGVPVGVYDKAVEVSREIMDMAAEAERILAAGVPVEAKEEVATALDDGAEMDAALKMCDEGVPFGAEECDTREDNVAANHLLYHFNAVDGGAVRVRKVARPSIPGWGQMELEGTVEECAKTLEMLLADKRVKLSVAWSVKQDG